MTQYFCVRHCREKTTVELISAAVFFFGGNHLAIVWKCLVEKMLETLMK